MIPLTPPPLRLPEAPGRIPALAVAMFITEPLSWLQINLSLLNPYKYIHFLTLFTSEVGFANINKEHV